MLRPCSPSLSGDFRMRQRIESDTPRPLPNAPAIRVFVDHLQRNATHRRCDHRSSSKAPRSTVSRSPHEGSSGSRWSTPRCSALISSARTRAIPTHGHPDRFRQPGVLLPKPVPSGIVACAAARQHQLTIRIPLHDSIRLQDADRVLEAIEPAKSASGSDATCRFQIAPIHCRHSGSQRRDSYPTEDRSMDRKILRNPQLPRILRRRKIAPS